MQNEKENSQKITTTVADEDKESAAEVRGEQEGDVPDINVRAMITSYPDEAGYYRAKVGMIISGGEPLILGRRVLFKTKDDARSWADREAKEICLLMQERLTSEGNQFTVEETVNGKPVG